VPFVAAVILLPAPGHAEYEQPPVLKAGDLLPAETLKGEHHTIDDAVKNDGYMNHFVIRSEFGDFEAGSEAMVPVRVKEVHALAELKKLSGTEVFASALGGAATKTVESLGRAVTDPVGTVQGVGEGVGRMFKRMSLSAKKATDAVKESSAEEQTAEGEASGDAGGEAAKNLIGYNKAKRGMAREMSIDPYSDNEVLQAELDRLAKAAFAGGLAFSTLAPSVPLQGEITMVSDMVWSQSPADLEVMNREKLAAMGVPEKTVNAFYKSRHFTPSTNTLLVALLEGMEGVDNRGAVVELAVGLESRSEALLFIRSVHMLREYHKKSALQKIVAYRALPWGVAASGKTIFAAAVDHLVWTEEIAAAAAAAEEARAADASLGKMEFLVSGTLSERTKKELAALGWSTAQKAN
jgi:hypothetical protein